MTKNTVLEEIKKLYPNAKEISINYWGDSDDFGEFHSLYVDGDEINDCNDFIAVAEDYMFSLFNQAGVSFIDAGADGCISFDIESREVTLYNTSKEYEYNEDGDIDYDEDPIEHEDKPEKFEL